VRRSVDRLGAGRSIVADASGTLIAGEATLRAAQDLGVPVRIIETDGSELVAVVRTDMGPDDPRRHALAIADNQTARLSEFDPQRLADSLRGLGDYQDLLEATGFDADAIADMLTPDTGDIAEDTIPESQSVVVTRPGDLWLLGAHRLLCGDSSDPRDVQRVTAGRQWDVVVLDPPFDAADSQWSRWIHDPSIVFGQAKHLRMIPDRLWRFERVIVKQYRHRSATVQIDHRHAFVAQVGSVKHLPHSTETFPSVIQQDNETEHDHAKPVGLLVEHLTQWTPHWSVVFDPYAGAGSTLIAADRMGRDCWAIEIDPEWVEVIVKRWEKLTGKSAQRIANEDVAAYNAGRAGAETPVSPEHPIAEKEQPHV
jgi:hypothetical protein